ncbi:MAG: cytochrome P450 [Bacteroidota bacterium]
MMLADGDTAAEHPLYPPTVSPPDRSLPLPLFLFRFVRNPLRGIPRAVYEEPLVSYKSGPAAMVWVTDPGLIERILLHEQDKFPKTPLEKRVFAETLGDGILTSEGAIWRWQRRTVAPLFRHADLLTYLPAMVEAADEQLERWRSGGNGTLRAVDRDMTATTFDVIARTMFSGDALAEGTIIQRAGGEFLESTSWEIAASLLRLPAWVWHPGKPAMRRSARELRAAVSSMIARRRASGTESQDLLGRLMRVRDPERGEPMSDKQLVDNLLTFLVAGHETTAKALMWTLYLLARAPHWQQRVRAEVREVAGATAIRAEHLDRLILTRQVLKESMRLYPPAPMMTRLTSCDVELAGTRIGPRVVIVIPIFAVHRHTKLWKDPSRFDPQRFAPENEKMLLRTQFMPFGFGQRTCIGMSFAMMEATAILATLVRSARFEWDGHHAPEPISRVTLRPKGGMPLAVTLIA